MRSVIMVKTRSISFLILIVGLIGFSFYYFYIRASYKYYIKPPDILTEQSCMKILKVYQPDIANLALEKHGNENFIYRQVNLDIDGLFLDGKRTITFVYPNQEFEGCNIMDIYIVDKLTEEPNFTQYFDCKNLDCKDIKCDEKDGRFFYTYRKINDYYELKYYIREPILEREVIASPMEESELLPEESQKGNVSITIQFLYFNRPLDKFIKHREESVCTEG